MVRERTGDNDIVGDDDGYDINDAVLYFDNARKDDVDVRDICYEDSYDNDDGGDDDDGVEGESAEGEGEDDGQEDRDADRLLNSPTFCPPILPGRGMVDPARSQQQSAYPQLLVSS